MSSTSEALEQQVLAERQRDDELDARMRELEDELVRVREEARTEKEVLEQQVLAERQRAEDERDVRMREFEEELAHVREEAHAQKEALEQQVLAERQRGDEELARVREEAHAQKEALEQQVFVERQRGDSELLARVRAELDQEWQQRDHGEEMRRGTDSQKRQERYEEQLSKVANLHAHREEFARKKEAMDKRWNEKLRWRDKTKNQFEGLCNMVQSVIDSCAEQKERFEQGCLAAEQRPCK